MLCLYVDRRNRYDQCIVTHIYLSFLLHGLIYLYLFITLPTVLRWLSVMTCYTNVDQITPQGDLPSCGF